MLFGQVDALLNIVAISSLYFPPNGCRGDYENLICLLSLDPFLFPLSLSLSLSPLTTLLLTPWGYFPCTTQVVGQSSRKRVAQIEPRPPTRRMAVMPLMTETDTLC